MISGVVIVPCQYKIDKTIYNLLLAAIEYGRSALLVVHSKGRMNARAQTHTHIHSQENSAHYN